ncbi:MAG TPA: alkene reductase [Betaproteobacteria bacterium]|nr:alkene reductase [Betaproteobacteria bacterium]
MESASAADTEVLFSPYPLSTHLTLSNRIVMAPMTRCMADDNLTPTAAMAAYYARRADAGLIVTEGTIIRADGQGYPNTPGIFSQQQIDGWREVTRRVHERGGKLFMQLWHVGRVSHPAYLNGAAPLAPSAAPMSGPLPRTRQQLQYGTPRALAADEIPALTEAYATAAANAMDAGVDGVEVHGANGYLIDQFLHHQTNYRTDRYGGAPENMARFALEVVDAVVARVRCERVGIRLSPGAYFNLEGRPDDVQVFDVLLPALQQRGLAYLHTGIFDDATTFDYLGGTATAYLRRRYAGALIACGSYTPQTAAWGIREERFDLIAIGRPLIANPDFVAKVRRGETLAPYDETMLGTLT